MIRACLVIGAASAMCIGVPAAAQHRASRVAVSPPVQAVRALRLLPGLQIGGVLPTGGLADFHGTGIRAGATLTAAVPTRPIGARLALTYDHLSGGTVVPPGGTVIDIDGGSMLSLSATALFSEQAERSALFYFTAGGGVHRLKAFTQVPAGGDDDEPTEEPDEFVVVERSETKVGASVGGGITFRLGGLPSYLEVQFVKLFGADAVLVPLVLGVQLER